MFSWECKGCGYELIQPELVRLNGQIQEYDGYGGSATNDSNYDPSAWHDRCYMRASLPHRLDESPSSHAPNQGFGPAKLEFLSGYNETIPIDEFIVAVDAVIYEEGLRFEFYYTNNGILEDQREYRQRYEEASNQIQFDHDMWNSMPQVEKTTYAEAYQAKLEEVLGSAMPERNIKKFSSLQEAIDAVDVLLPNLPAKLGGEYDLIIYGKQGKIQGAVYERYVHRACDNDDELEIEEPYRFGLEKPNLADEQLNSAIIRFNEAHQEFLAAYELLKHASEHFDKDRLPQAFIEYETGILNPSAFFLKSSANKQ